MEHQDRRIRKTKTALCNALSQLMETQEFHTISVRALCDAADIHRATFYYHYSDIYAFYQEIEASFLTDITVLFDVDSNHTYETPFFNRIVNYVDVHAPICRIFLSQATGMGTYRKLVDTIKAQYLKIWQTETHTDELPRDWHFLTDYHIQGCLAIIASWLDTGRIQPKSEITALLLEIDTEFDNIVERHYAAKK